MCLGAIKMKNSIYFIAILILALENIQAKTQVSTCKLKKNESITIGCTYECNKFVRWGLKSAAKKLKYNLEIKNIYREDGQVFWNELDGVLIPGGVDIDPKYYTENLPEALQQKIKDLDKYVVYTAAGVKRDKFEFNLLKQYQTNNNLTKFPIYGICRGMQMLGVSHGIPLYVDIEAELGFRNRMYVLDRVHYTTKESIMYDVMSGRKFRGLELHHQGLRVDYFNENKSVYPNLKITGLSNHGKIAEILERTDRPLLGTQFHPELTFGIKGTRKRIFKWFLSKACENKISKQ